MKQLRGEIQVSAFRSCKGGITVFLCIIFVALLALTGVLLDAGRIMMAERRVQSALNTSVRSVLADYDADLIGDYGIFALDTASEKGAINIESMFQKYLNLNLVEKNSSSNFINYDIVFNSTSMDAFGNILSNDVFKNQIIGYMKYRAPLSTAQNLIDRFLSSGLGEKIDFSKTEKGMRTKRKDVKHEIENINKIIEETNNINVVGVDSLKGLKTKLSDIRYAADGINTSLYAYGTAKDESDKAAGRGSFDSTQTEFGKVKKEIEILQERITDNTEKVDVLIKTIEVPGKQTDNMNTEIEEMIDSFVLEEMNSILLVEPTNTEKTPFEPGIINKMKALINDLMAEQEKYVRCLDGDWLVSADDMAETVSNDKTGYGDMAGKISNSHIEADDAEKDNDNAISFLQDFFECLKNVAVSSIEKVCVAEYIMVKYTYVTSKIERGHYFDKGEVEYILCGNKSQAANITGIVARISFLRFCIDFIDYFATSKNPHPVFRLIYAIGRGFIQSCKDVYDLFKGEGIGICPSLADKGDIFKLNYADHLFLFLLLQKESCQLNNMRQLIQVNMKQYNPSFALGNFNTVLHAKAEVRINLWFLPVFRPDSLGVSGFERGKYVIRKETYIGF